MALGPGKYDDLCAQVRIFTRADGVVLIVLGGNRGHGSAVQIRADASPQADLLVLALREVADQLERDIKERRASDA